MDGKNPSKNMIWVIIKIDVKKNKTHKFKHLTFISEVI